MSERKRLTRRSFLRTTGVAAATMTTLSAGNAARAAGANDRMTMAIVGCGKIGQHHLDKLLALREAKEVEILAVCDVYETRAREFQQKIKAAGGNARLVRDYRDVLAMKDVDYVLLSVPEHSHADLALAALDAGKHVYCEKPVTHTIAEAQAVLAKVKETGLKLQVGVQGMSDQSYAAAYEAIRAGKIGPVVQAQLEYCRNHSAGTGPWRREDLDFAMPKPGDLDWGTWLGPAPKRPWDPHRYFEWRNYRDYSGGVGTDLFVHRITRIIKSCGLTLPTRVVGMGGIYLWPDGRELPDNFELLAEYPAVEGITPGMTVHILGTMANRHRIEHCIRGHKGTLVFERKKGWKILEADTEKVVETYELKGAEDVSWHHRNLHAAIRDNAALHCPAELGLYGLAPVRMANLSWFEKKMLTWDAKQGKAVAT